jgi:hypothetical protein
VFEQIEKIISTTDFNQNYEVIEGLIKEVSDVFSKLYA